MIGEITEANQEDIEMTGAIAEDTQEGVVQRVSIEGAETVTTSTGMQVGPIEMRKNGIEDSRNMLEAIHQIVQDQHLRKGDRKVEKDTEINRIELIRKKVKDKERKI